MSKAVNSKWKKTFPDTIGNQNRPANGVDDTQPFETGGFPQYIANDPVRYDLQNAAMSQSMSNDARLKEMVDARGKELDDHKVDLGAHKTGIAGNAATATKVVTTAAAGASANIAEATMASSDYARIRVSGNDNAGELALETADDGSEPIVARQYTGAYTNAVRTAKILDESGNTSFPGTVVAPKFTGALNGNAATATKLQTPRTISLTGNASGSATFDGSGNISINTDVNYAAQANKLADESGNNHININSTTDSWSVIGSNPGNWLKSIRTNPSAPPYSIGNYSAAVAFGGYDTKGIITHAYDNPLVKFAGGNGSTAVWKFSIKGGSNNEVYDLNNFPTKTGSGASGTWPISISGNAATATTANALNGIINREPATNNHAIIPGANARDYCEFHEYGAVWNFIKTSDEGSTTVASIRSDGFHGNVVGNASTATNADTVDEYHASDIISKIYPVGSIYMSMVATNPATLFGIGTWKRISQGRMLLGADDSTYKAGATGGEAAHTLSVNEMPVHSHGISNSGDHSHYFYGSNNDNGPLTEGDGLDTEGNDHFTRNVRFTTSSAGAHTHTISNSGGGAAHNNMPPYLVCYIWQRTA